MAPTAQCSSVAICFLLASPRPETRLEAVARAVRVHLSRIPFAGRVVRPHWSPARRAGYGAGLRACVQSLRRRHTHVPPIFVLRPVGQELTMADVDGVIPFDPGPYESIPVTGTYFGREVFYKLELFTQRGFERIVYFDCDTLAVGDVSALWDPAQYTERGLYAVREDAVMGVPPELFGKFNTGVMVINRTLLDDAVYARLLEIARSGVSYDGGDQGVINAYLSESAEPVAGDLDAPYNVLVRAKKEGDWSAFKDRLKILHFVNGLKPWSDDHRYDWMFDEELKRTWDDAYRFASTASASDATETTSQ